MKNDQQEPDSKSLWGLKKKPPTNKPKEERMLETRILNNMKTLTILKVGGA